MEIGSYDRNMVHVLEMLIGIFSFCTVEELLFVTELLSSFYGTLWFEMDFSYQEPFQELFALASAHRESAVILTDNSCDV